jgi:hypothetical protein
MNLTVDDRLSVRIRNAATALLRHEIGWHAADGAGAGIGRISLVHLE